MRIKEKKHREQSVLQLIMHPTTVNAEMVITPKNKKKNIVIKIKEIELSLNDHQLSYLIGIIETVLLPTSPVAVEHLTNELETNNDKKIYDMRHVITLRKNLLAEIHSIQWLLNSPYSQFWF